MGRQEYERPPFAAFLIVLVIVLALIVWATFSYHTFCVSLCNHECHETCETLWQHLAH
jgi:hypothetical protein